MGDFIRYVPLILVYSYIWLAGWYRGGDIPALHVQPPAAAGEPGPVQPHPVLGHQDALQGGDSGLNTHTSPYWVVCNKVREIKAIYDIAKRKDDAKKG